MSLTNPNKVITEERLSEFYQSILPYLGGMPDILANKFNKSDLYSTSEKMIGQWIDGKPLYQKTFQTTSPSQLSVSTAVVDLSSSGIDKIVDLESFIYDTSNITYQGGGSFICWVRYPLSLQNFEIACQVTNQSYLNDTMLITIQYTKTTDSPISIGNDTDYSTTEKIVGTWIDGKPIYQKTVTGLSLEITYDSFTNTNISASGVDTIIRCSAYDVNGTYVDLICNSYGGGSAGTTFNVQTTRNNSVVRNITTITFQYTKTTD